MSTCKDTVVPVRTPSRSYEVHVGRGILDEVGRLVRESAGGEVAAVVTDSNVGPLYAERALSSLAAAGYRTALVSFPAGERSKRLSTLGDVLESLAEEGLGRDDVVVALGGGVCGDMAGLAAALYQRGCKVAQVPTSLLAMVDSSVGGKTAVDLEAGKNLAGAFLQPSVVVADVDCLDTLSPELLRDSCGEVIKHGVIADESLFEEVGRRPLSSAGYPKDELVRVVARNVEIKRDVVVADEREHGLRQTLNFGHTIGHAIEAASEFRLGHGTCVAAGMCCMSRAAAARGWCSQQTARAVERVVAAHGLPLDTDLDHDLIMHFATHDKKRHGDSVNVVVPRRIGSVEIRKTSLGELRELVDLGCGTCPL
ncbi:MAG: 3-dehydroquinate synthase [Olsenella sp.]|nr:3-dehydroquinate synthase [Olsenella sp.]